VAFAVLCVRLVLQLWGYMRAFVQGMDEPVGVPLVLDAATVAAREAEHVSRREDKGAN
jgi:hypothetical protein